MPQLKDDEWPADRESTTHEQQVARDPINGPKDPHDERRPPAGGTEYSGRDRGARNADDGIPEFEEKK